MASEEQRPESGRKAESRPKRHAARLAVTATIMVVVGLLVSFSPRLVLVFQPLFIPLFVGMTVMIVFISVWFTRRLVTSRVTTAAEERPE